MKTVGMYLVELLAAYGVDTVFGIPGVHTIDLYRGLAGSRIRHITARHEQGLGFMADGYARASGRPGVCFVITGPGMTNIATAMAQAYADSIPMLVISSVNALGKLGSGNGHLHEMPDQRTFTSGVAEFSHTITRAEELSQVIARAFAVFSSGRPRPVHIELPLDVINADALDLPAIPPAPPRAKAGPAASQAIEDARIALEKSRLPVIFAGGGALGAAAEVQWLAEMLDAPVVMTINGRGILPAGHPLAISLSASSAAVRAMMRESDLVIALGTELGPTDYDLYADGSFEKPANLLRIDIDAQQLFRNAMPTLPLAGDVGETLRALRRDGLAGLRANAGASRAAACRAAGMSELDAITSSDLRMLAEVSQVLPQALIVGDSTRLVYSGNLGYEAPRPRAWFNASVGFGSLGYGLPAAIGASLAEPARKVVCLAGDGGFQFTLGELGTAYQHGANLIVLLLNNGGYGEIKSAMLGRGVEPIGVDLHTPDFVAIAEAYGWSAERIDAGAPLAQTLAAAAQRGTPHLIELMVR
ncbi:5-guanidino-2-oxopentanoate decarboxylase [Paraburkholderia fungorum]|uniref:5-guanidino-2-oxopentanoate decarboxylase n=1 Tax=Paraburkholderia fungorum TaxID=134537 RepID=UPI0038BDE4EA